LQKALATTGFGTAKKFCTLVYERIIDMHITPRPPEKTWADAKLYRCDLYDTRYPVCGTRLVWVNVGWKWVRLCTPIQHDKWRIRRAEWDKIPHDLFVKKENDDD
tara:strand:+ start:867 stop:1181 length:315 start_codon:yes stop_codon:yes gene_type:complete